MINDVTYCNGKNCGIKEYCRRYVDGERIKKNVLGDTDQHRWWDECEGDYRGGYIMI